ncbi:glycosyltransferase family 33 protein [Xylariaceae sp. FL0594]|nr:glycosyltransferase family 33 protein [Xylariaceae sp. FL0594]
MGYLAITIWTIIIGFLLLCLLFLLGVAFEFLLPSKYDHDRDLAEAKEALKDLHEIRADRRTRPVIIQILVLGDIGRSPRMQYHARSIAKHGGIVYLVGYLESPLHPNLVGNPRVILCPLTPFPGVFRSIPFMVAGPLKVIWQACTAGHALLYRTPACKFLLVQNPPTIPTLAVTMLVSVLRRTWTVIDWHNYGWSILAGTKGANHPFVKLAKAHESMAGASESLFHITVTEAMKKDLQRAPYNIPERLIFTLHDRPADLFQPTLLQPGEGTPEDEARAKKQFLERIPVLRHYAPGICDGSVKLIVSSTSWTPDEDFSLLLDALVTYAEDPDHPPTIAVITGKGPQKAHYEALISDLDHGGRLPGVTVLTLWLASLEDYGRLLACADLGVCLHKSSSGVDLPMKVVDMFGAGLPVVAYSGYESFGELVREGFNGCGFETSDELAATLLRLLGQGGGVHELARLKQGALEESRRRWDSEWDSVLGPNFGLTKRRAGRRAGGL